MFNFPSFIVKIHTINTKKTEIFGIYRRKKSFHFLDNKIKELSVEKIEIEESRPLRSIKTQVQIPVITFEKKSKKIKNTSEFITNNQDLFSRFIPNSMQLRSFGDKFKENNTIGVLKNIGLSSGVSFFTEFEFAPPIS